MTVGHVAGLAHIQFWRIDSAGRMMGQSTTIPPTSNTTVSAYKHPSPTSFDVSNPERTRVDLRGGDTIQGSLYFGANTPVTGSFSTETVDSILFNLAEGTLTDTTTVSGWEIFGTDDQNPAVNTLGCCVTMRWQSRDTGTDGTNLWLNQIMLLQMSPGVPPARFQSVDEGSIAVTAIPMSRFPNGVAFGANQGFYNNKTSVLEIVTTNPLAFTTYIADGVSTSFTVPYLPVSSTVTAATEPNYMAINGTETAPSAISTTTGEVTLAAAGSSDDVVSIMYATDFTPSS